MPSIGSASLQIVPSFDGIQGYLDRGTAGPLSAAGTKGGAIFGNAAGRSAGSRFGSLFKSAAKASLVGLAGAGALAVKFGGDAVSAASDLEESTNKVAQVFGKNADEVFKFTEAAADKLGQANTQAREAAATFGIFGNAAGLSDRKAAKFATRMTTLASDLASFNNTEPEEAVQALAAALRGESEPIRAYGVLLDEATLKAEALRLGILKPVKDQSKILAYQTNVTVAQKNYNEAVKESGKDSLEALKAQASLGTAQSSLQKATEGVLPPLTQQQKLLAAQSQIFKQTEVAQGDFARTSDGLANQQRRLAARFENAKAELGRGLLPIMTDAADFLLDKGIPAFEDFADWFNREGIPKLKQFGGFVKDEVFPVLKDLKDFAGDAAGVLADVFGFLDKMPSEAKLAALSTALGGGALLKLRSGKGGLGAVGSALGVTKPIPVIVTNPGFAAGGAGGTRGSTGAVVATNGKGGKHAATRSGAGRGVGALALLPLVPEIIEELRWPWTEGPFAPKNFKSGIGATVKDAAVEAAQVTADAMLEFDKKVPKTLRRHFELLGVPESEEHLRHLLRTYDIVPRKKVTTLELLGYEPMLDRIQRINRELDWAARPREARISITKVYADAGYETRGGLQQGGGTTTTQTGRSRAGGGLG